MNSFKWKFSSFLNTKFTITALKCEYLLYTNDVLHIDSRRAISSYLTCFSACNIILWKIIIKFNTYLFKRLYDLSVKWNRCIVLGGLGIKCFLCILTVLGIDHVDFAANLFILVDF